MADRTELKENELPPGGTASKNSSPDDENEENDLNKDAEQPNPEGDGTDLLKRTLDEESDEEEEDEQDDENSDSEGPDDEDDDDDDDPQPGAKAGSGSAMQPDPSSGGGQPPVINDDGNPNPGPVVPQPPPGSVPQPPPAPPPPGPVPQPPGDGNDGNPNPAPVVPQPPPAPPPPGPAVPPVHQPPPAPPPPGSVPQPPPAPPPPGPAPQPPNPAYLNGLQNDPPNIQRRKVLKKVLVADKDHSKKAFDRPDAQIGHTTSLEHEKRADDTAKYLGIGGQAVAGVGSLQPALGAGLQLAGLGSDTFDDWSKSVMSSDQANDAFSGISAIGNGAMAVGSGVSTVTNFYRAKNDKSKHKRKTSTLRGIAGAFGTLGSLGALGSNLTDTNLFGERGTKDGTGAQTAGGWMDIAAGISDALRCVFDTIGNYEESKGHQEISQQAGAIWGGPQNNAAKDQAIAAADAAIANAGGNQAAMKAAREQKHAAKAERYAMEQAARLHELRANEPIAGKNKRDIAGTVVNVGGALFKGIAKVNGNGSGIAGAIGTLLGTAAAGTKFGVAAEDMGEQKKKDEALADLKRTLLDEYFARKMNSVETQLQQKNLSAGEMAALGNDTTMSDDEKKIILLLRLGVDVPDNVNAVTQELKDEGFKKLTVKRANNILKASQNERHTMLRALGFDDPDKATLEDVVAALSGD